jgi:hypothetical protein
MCDFIDDYDDFENGDSFGDEFDEETELDDLLAGDSEFEDETDPAESKDREFTASDAFLVGSFAGWAYEEGLKERKRRKHKKVSGD